MKQWWQDEDKFNEYSSMRWRELTKEDETALVGAIVDGSEYTYDGDMPCGFSLYLRSRDGKQYMLAIEGPPFLCEESDYFIDISIVDWD